LEAVARDEIAAYFRDADDAVHPAARMAHLNDAAQIARDRGIGECLSAYDAALRGIR
jgi:hypothetical protein